MMQLRMTLATAILCVATMGFAINDAAAKRVSISGTQTYASVKKKCPGCDCWNNGGGFGCENKGKGTGVYCTTKGKCTGLVPD